MLFQYKQKSFGLDISERKLRLVQLKKIKRKAQIISYGEVSLTSGVIQNGKIVDSEKFLSALRGLIKNCQGQHISTKNVVACLPERQTFIKLINLTYPDSKSLVEEINNETKKHIPYPLEKTYLDWQFINEKDKTKTLIAVCPKEVIDNYQDILNRANLVLTTLEIEAVAICRCLIECNQEVLDTIIILDLGANRTSLIIYQGQAVLYSLSINFSADELTLAIKDKLKLSLEEAEKAKKICGLNPQKAEGGVKKILELQTNKLAEQIREAKYFYYEHFSKEKEIKKVILTGGGCLLPGLTNYLAKQCQLDFELANPLINLYQPAQDLLPENIQSFDTAIGLALRDIQK
jgi:type IV pilus assembly protein PilM